MFLETKELVNKCLAIDDPGFSDSLAGGEGGTIFLPTSFYDTKEVFTTNSCGTKNTQSVSLKTGLLKVKQRLFTSEGSRLPFNLSVSYNQEYGNKLAVWDNVSPLIALGWKFNYQQSVKIIDGFAYYCDGDFNLHKLEPTGDKYFEKETGLVLTVLKEGSSITGYEITNDQSLKLSFDYNGKLKTITSKNGSTAVTTSITHDGYSRISTVTDGLGKVYTFTYSNNEITVKDSESNVVCKLIPQTNTNFLGKVELSDGCFYSFESRGIRLQSVFDGVTKIKTIFRYDKENRVKNIFNYEIVFSLSEEIKKLCDTKTITYDEDRVMIKRAKRNQPLNEQEQVYYYFATNGDLIHTSNKHETLFNKLTVNSKKEFKYCDMALSDTQIANLPVSDDNESEIIYASDIPLVGEAVMVPSQSVRPVLCVLSAVCQMDENNGDVTVLLKNEDDQSLTSLSFENVSDNTSVIKTAVFELPAGENTLHIETSGAENAMISDVKIFRLESEDREVISLNSSKQEFTQTINGVAQIWYDTKDTTFDFTYNGSEISNVKFTLADYTKTMLGKFKSPTSFNFWYNDGENLITDCASLSIRPSGTQEAYLSIDEIKYASLTISEKAKSYSYISSVTSTQLTISEYLHIGEEYKLKTSVYNNCMQLSIEIDYQQINHPGIQTKYTYDSYGDCIKTETNKAGSTNVETKLVNDYTYTNGKLTSEKGYYKLLRPATSYAYGLEDSISQITDPNGNIYSYGYLADSETFKSISSSGITNGIEYEYGRIKKLTTNGTDHFTYEYNENNELIKVIPTRENGSEYTSFSLPISKQTKKKTLFHSVIEQDHGDGNCILMYYDDFSNLRKITEFNKNTLLETPLRYYYYWDENSWNVLNEQGEKLNESAIKSLLLNLDRPLDPFNTIFKVSGSSKLCLILDIHGNNGYNSYEAEYLDGSLYKISQPSFSLYQTFEERDEIDRVTTSKIEFTDSNVEITNVTNYTNLFSDDISQEKVSINDQVLQFDYTCDNLNRTTTVEVLENNLPCNKTEYSFIPAQEQILVENDGPTGGMVGGLPVIPRPTYETVNIGTTNFIGEIKQTEYTSSGSLTTTTQVEYDKNGNITKYGDATYVYDSLNRLTRENNNLLSKTITYSYDERNNLREKVEYAYTNAVSLSNPIRTTTFAVGGWKDQITSVTIDNETTNLYYDKLGRLTSTSGDVLIRWDDNGQLDFYHNGPICYSLQSYDANGNRTYSSFLNDDETYYCYTDGKLRTQISYNKDNVVIGRLDFLYNSTGLVGFYYNDDLYTYRKNLFGDITEIYKGSELVAKYIYDAWGNHKICNPDGSENPNESFIGNINPFRYRSYFYDRKMSLYYLKSRYYSPELGRFISPDSIEYLEPDKVNGLNLYAYCGNNPIMYVDPNGHASLLVIALISGAISAAANIFTQIVLQDKEFNDIGWSEVIISGVAGFASGLIPGNTFISIVGQSVVSALVENGLRSVIHDTKFDISKVYVDTIINIFVGIAVREITYGINKLTSKITNKIFIKAPNYSQYQYYFRKQGFDYTRDEVCELMHNDYARAFKIDKIINGVTGVLFDFISALF